MKLNEKSRMKEAEGSEVEEVRGPKRRGRWGKWRILLVVALVVAAIAATIAATVRGLRLRQET